MNAFKRILTTFSVFTVMVAAYASQAFGAIDKSNQELAVGLTKPFITQLAQIYNLAKYVIYIFVLFLFLKEVFEKIKAGGELDAAFFKKVAWWILLLAALNIIGYLIVVMTGGPSVPAGAVMAIGGGMK